MIRTTTNTDHFRVLKMVLTGALAVGLLAMVVSVVVSRPASAAQAVPVSFTQNQYLGTGSSPFNVTSADFNNDGSKDLAVTNSFHNTVSVLLDDGNGTGTFGEDTKVTVGSRPSSVTSTDFNGDGNADLAVTSYNSSTVSVLLGNGTGTFGTPTNIGLGSGSKPFFVTSADFNNDGKADLAVAHTGTTKISVLLGNGDGTFGADTKYEGGGQGSGYMFPLPLPLTSADFDDDGNTDLAVANYNADTVSVLLGNGDGSFDAPTTLPGTFDEPSSVTSADFNDDNKADLAVTNETSDDVSVLLGNGDGTFVPAGENLVVGSSPQAVTSADFDNDESADLAVANQNSSTVSVLVGNGDGTFNTAQNLAVIGEAAVHLISTDFNADEKPDLAVANQSTNNVSVMLNTTPFPNNPPTANGDSYTVAEDAPLVVEAPGVLENDDDPDGDTLSALGATGPAHGELSLQPNGFFLYTPNSDYNGEDSFTYKASDGTAKSDEVTVSITVSPVDEPPAPNTAPSITVLSPRAGSATHDRTPTIRATVLDAGTDLSKSKVRLWVDGRRVEAFSYDRANDRLTYTTKKLDAGRHKVLIVARDGEGLSASRYWGFRVKK